MSERLQHHRAGDLAQKTPISYKWKQCLFRDEIFKKGRKENPHSDAVYCYASMAEASANFTRPLILTCDGEHTLSGNYFCLSAVNAWLSFFVCVMTCIFFPVFYTPQPI